MNIPYVIYRAVYTESSLEAGEAEYTDTADEGTATLTELVGIARHRYGISGRAPRDTTGWWESTDAAHDRDFYEKGIQKFYTLHIPGLTELRRERINRILLRTR